MAIRFLGKTFATRASLIEHAQRVRDKDADGQRIRGADERHVLALLKANPDCSTKVGNRRIHTSKSEPTSKYQTRAFFVVFTDGSFVDFSFMKAIKNLFGGQATRAA